MKAPEPAPATPAPQAAEPAPVAPRVQPAAAPAPAPPADEAPVDRDRLIVVADSDVESGKAVIGQLAAWGLQPVLVHDGVEAIMTIQRMLPRVVILDAALPKMYGFQICELIKRNESLRSIHVMLVGAVHHPDRYRRPPNELYGADKYLEKPNLLDELDITLSGFGLQLTSGSPAPSQPMAPPPQAAPAQPVASAPAVEPPAPAVEPVASPPVQAPPTPAAAPAPQPAGPADGLEQERANAERLARIIVSDILLYHPEQFDAGLASGRLAEALDGPIEEGRGFFAQRVDPRVRDERDYLIEELTRVAKQRAGGA